MEANVKFRIKGTRLYVKPMPHARASVPYESASTAARFTNWKINTGGPNATLGASLATLRSRSRDVVRKNGLADRGLETLVNNVVGTGIKPQFNTSDAGLNRELAELWLDWTDESDADDRFDFYGQEALAFRSMLEGGDVFARLRTRRLDDVDSVPLQIQLLESEFCPAEKNETISQGRLVQNGVEFDAIGRRTAYWLYRDHPNDGILRQAGNTMPKPVPASEIVHLAAVRRPGMIRGEPWLTRALIKLYELDQYDDAQLVRQKLAAMFAGFMTPSADGKFAYQDDADGDGLALASLEPGTLQVLPPGATMNFTSPPSVGDSYEAFMTQQHRYIAGSLGILYEQLTGDFSKVNDRTWRAAMNEFKRSLQRWQHSMVVFQFCRPIMRRWMEYATLSGKIKLPAGITEARAARPKWIPQAMEYINPVQDVQARRDEVRSGFASRAEMVSERGYDVEALDAEIAADNARADALDLRFDSDGRSDLKGGVPVDDAEAAAEKATAGMGATAQALTVMAETSRIHADATRAAAEKPPANIALPPVNIENHMPHELRQSLDSISGALAGLATAVAEMATRPEAVINIPAQPPQPAPVVNVVTKDPPKRKTRMTVEAHDAKGRIKSFTQEDI